MRRLFAQMVVVVFGAIALVGLGGVSSLLATHQDTRTVADSSADLAAGRAQLADAQHELERAHQILEFSGRYSIPADLSALIYDHAVEEGIPAGVGFQLVR